MNYSVLNILDLIDAIGEEKVKLLLSDFSCSKNTEIETFVHYRGVEFSKKNMSIMYLVINDVRELIAIFSLAHKAVDIGNDVLSNELRRRIIDCHLSLLLVKLLKARMYTLRQRYGIGRTARYFVYLSTSQDFLFRQNGRMPKFWYERSVTA
jgi:hypothetical protein